MKKVVSITLMAGAFACSCANQKELDMNNPFFQKWNTPYEIPPFEKIKNEHYIPAFEEGIKQQEEEVAAIVNQNEPPTFANTVEALEFSGDLLNKVAAVFFNILQTNSSEEMQKIAEDIMPKLTAHEDNINLNKPLFERVRTVFENREKENLNPEQMRLLTELYKNFVRGGANLPEEKQERFRKVNEELAVLTLKFDNNVLAATNAYQLVIDKKEDLAGLPESLVKAAEELGNQNAATKGKWVFVLQNPSLLPFLQYADNRAKREEIWQAYSTRCRGGEFDNTENIAKILKLRIERAQLLGFNTHADFVLDDRMAKTPAAVYELLLKVWVPALQKAKEEAAMYWIKAGKEKIQPWDWRYYTEKVRKEMYDLDEDSIRPYFSLDGVREGVFMVSNKLYGITFKLNKELPTYDPKAYAYEVIDKGEVIGILYLDYYTRSSKSSGAWMTEFRGQYKTKEGKRVIPIISVVLNNPNPTADAPSLLNFDETETFFHEMGHALHGLLSDCQYRSLAGTNVPRDFVELPSQIMENWASHPEVMKMYAKHYVTGETIEQELIDKIEKSGNYGQGFINTELIAASLLDMDYHTLTDAEDINPLVFEEKAMEKYGLIPEIISRYKSPYFKHIFTSAMGYSAGYYSYTWSAVLDADAFEAFKENGLFDPKTAESFRKNILERGNTDDLMKLYIIFRGKEPSSEPLLKNRGLK
ncbi:MAG: M3 family metallopeptidase [Lentimicrobiaceae bacterium]|nr:M3 family metallopeptidase [Lentimicrobiaceae bacterium]